MQDVSPALMLARRGPRATVELLGASTAPSSGVAGSWQRSSVRSCHWPAVRAGGRLGVPGDSPSTAQHSRVLQTPSPSLGLWWCRRSRLTQGLEGVQDGQHRVHVTQGDSWGHSWGHAWGKGGGG